MRWEAALEAGRAAMVVLVTAAATVEREELVVSTGAVERNQDLVLAGTEVAVRVAEKGRVRVVACLAMALREPVVMAAALRAVSAEAQSAAAMVAVVMARLLGSLWQQVSTSALPAC